MPFYSRAVITQDTEDSEKPIPIPNFVCDALSESLEVMGGVSIVENSPNEAFG